MKPRKIICSVNSPAVKEIMALIETQSKTTLAKWAITYAEKYILPIYKKSYEDFRLEVALNAAKQWFNKNMKLPKVKEYIYDCHLAAKEVSNNPAAEAAARAVAQAASIAHTPLHTLGAVLYGVTAIVYDNEPFPVNVTIYDELADFECRKMYNALKAIAIIDETEPVNLDWTAMTSENALFYRSYKGRKTQKN